MSNTICPNCGNKKSKPAILCLSCRIEKMKTQKMTRKDKIDYNAEGHIYKITNLKNNKCYIGQTKQSCEARWKEHKKKYKSSKNFEYNYPLYRAFRKYGIENFTFELIESCKVRDLDEREQYWIEHYNSFGQGYNQSKGGGGLQVLNLDETLVIEKYKELKTIGKCAKYFNCSYWTITNILKKHNEYDPKKIEAERNKGLAILQYSLKNELLNEFPSRSAAGLWLLENKYETNKAKTTVGRKVHNAIMFNDGNAFGFIWKYKDSDK